MKKITITTFNKDELLKEIEENDELTISFDDYIKAEDCIAVVDEVCKYENDIVRKNEEMYDKIMANKKPEEVITNIEEEPIHNIIFYLKNLPDNVIVEVMRYALHKEEMLNSSFILNILNLIKTYNAFNDDFFNNDLIFYKDIISMVGIKTELNSDIQEVQKNVAIWLFSVFKSLNKVEYTFMDEHYKMPNLYKRIFQVSDLVTIAGIISKIPNFSTSELKNVDNAMFYASDFAKKLTIGNKFLEMFLDDHSKKRTNSL